MSDLDADLRALVDAAAAPVTPGEVAERGPASGGPSRPASRVPDGWRRPLVATASLVVVAVATVGIVVATTGPPAPRPPGTPTGTTPAARWQLTASLSDAEYQLATGNPGAISQVSCGGPSTCFLSTYYGVGGASSVTGATYVSHDAGHHWSPSTLPTGVATATAVSCVTASWCSAGGGLLDPKSGDPLAKKELRDPVLLTTTDAGATWQMHKVPIPPAIEYIPAYQQFPAETTFWPGVLDAVDCTSVDVCDVVGHVLDASSSAAFTPDRLEFLRTTDGGVTWTRTVLPERASESGSEVDSGQFGTGAALACPSSTHCVVLAGLSDLDPNDGVVDGWTSSDGGHSWHESQVQGAHQFFPGLSCPTSQVCWGGPTGDALLRSVDGGLDWELVPAPSAPSAGAPTGTVPATGTTGGSGSIWQSISCPTARSCVLGGAGMVMTDDDGATWAPVTLPTAVGAVPSVSCEPSGFCVALADPVSSFESSGGSLVLTNGPAPSGRSGSAAPG